MAISEDRITEGTKWDGLKDYITNTDLEAEKVIAEYHDLWVVEQAFRISKGTLEMRPMSHFTERICICLVAYKVYKELERIIKESNVDMSVNRVLDTAKTVTTIKIRMPENGKVYIKTLFLAESYRTIQPLFNLLNKEG